MVGCYMLETEVFCYTIRTCIKSNIYSMNMTTKIFKMKSICRTNHHFFVGLFRLLTVKHPDLKH
ncbi:hypothetical protein Hdeb2414_s0003g00082461 [Helianthus debilis subsp. tardiflorus]